MKQIPHNDLLFVELPTEAYDVFLLQDPAFRDEIRYYYTGHYFSGKDYNYGANPYEGLDQIILPPGRWQLVGRVSEVMETDGSRHPIVHHVGAAGHWLVLRKEEL